METIKNSDMLKKEPEKVLKEFNGFSSVSDFTNDGFKNIVAANRAVNVLPTGSSRDLYVSHPTYTRIMNSQSERLLNIIHNAIKNQNITGNIVRRDHEEKFELLQECNDAMLERINSNLDDLDGLKKTPQTILVQTQIENTPQPKLATSGSWNNTPVSKPTHAAMAKSAKLLAARNITRPQVNFKIPIDNRPFVPFVPKIREKPNSLKPLAVLAEYDDDGNICSYLHPYEFELDKFEAPATQLTVVIPQKPLALEAVPLVYVENDIQLKQLLADLMVAPEIAVDLEHHSYRTFQGITCLMQISTRQKDYIIDTLSLREELHILNEVFTKPSIVKIFHGADCDIEWLQRDLSLYIVNLFDTHQAAKRLGFARLSLAFLLKHYCDIDADKTFQLADWRIRPLPEELIMYARQDTHYLLYIYDLLRNELLKLGNGKTNILQSAIQSSTDICKKRFVKHRIDDESHLDLYNRSKRLFDNRQLYALKEVYAWRDKIARQEDESYGYVLPNHMILQISESLPREMQGILACCSPIPPLVRQHLNTLHSIMLKARQQSMIKPIATIATQREMSRQNNMKLTYDIENPLYCPHDMSQQHELRDDLPTIIDSPELELPYNENFKLKAPKIPAFNPSEERKTNPNSESKSSSQSSEQKFLSPYQRYLQILPFVEEEKLKMQALAAQLDAKKRLCPERVENPSPMKAEQKNDIYKLPQKEMGKRKHSESFETPTRENVTKKFKPIDEKDKLPFRRNVKSVEQEIKINQSSEDDESSDSHSEAASGSGQRNEKNQKLQAIVDALNVAEEKIKPDDDKYTEKTGFIESKNQKKRRLQKNRKQLTKPSDFRQSSNKTIPFDYTKVDYKKFQGGSQKYENVVTKNKNKGGKKVNINSKKLDNMFSFSSVKIKKI